MPVPSGNWPFSDFGLPRLCSLFCGRLAGTVVNPENYFSEDCDLLAVVAFDTVNDLSFSCWKSTSPN
ncbi:MAG: hypothetical protein VX830_07315 [Candidatus Poribacteria bacterium]|nr:hypothetical protein [Candidatus Poribacteria bacterium]